MPAFTCRHLTAFGPSAITSKQIPISREYRNPCVVSSQVVSTRIPRPGCATLETPGTCVSRLRRALGLGLASCRSSGFGGLATLNVILYILMFRPASVPTVATPARFAHVLGDAEEINPSRQLLSISRDGSMFRVHREWPPIDSSARRARSPSGQRCGRAERLRADVLARQPMDCVCERSIKRW